MNNIFYKPEGAFAADFIPFYKDGRFRLFYLHDWRNPVEYGEGTPWYQISTVDFVHFTEYGEALPRGSKEDQDLYVFTGSVMEAQGLYHIFYTGYNPHFRSQGKREQAVMHAVSMDLLTWRKVPEDTFYAQEDIYEPHDWRDPFVFWNEEAGEYWMLLAARLKKGPSRRRGCTALCVSKDLKHWEVREPFYAPGLYYTHECPDLFKMGDWWYLIFSEFSERCVTRYCRSRSINGPWTLPKEDTFDGRAYYAAKTYDDGEKRFIFGWNPTREGEKDYQGWQWGGNLVVHELMQDSDGILTVKVPDTVDKAFNLHLPASFTAGLGKWNINENHLSSSATGTFSCAVASDMTTCCKITAEIIFEENTRGCGIMLNVNKELEQAYYIRLEPLGNRLVIDSWPRNGDNPFMLELERTLELLPNKRYEIKVIVENTICEVYVENIVAMSTRLYNLKEGQWGVFVNDGKVDFENICFSSRQ